MSKDRLTRLAMELLLLGVSKAGVERLLGSNDVDEVERQLAYLPYRKARRPEALIIEAVRRRYSAPPLFYAKNQTHAPGTKRPVDQDSQPAA